jgi:hypothetical protein
MKPSSELKIKPWRQSICKMGEGGLVKKVFWTHDVRDFEELNLLKKGIIESCRNLEEQGYGLLEDANNPGKIDPSCSVVSPDGKIFTPEQINSYLSERKGNFSSENKEDMKMHKIYMYYIGFKE